MESDVKPASEASEGLSYAERGLDLERIAVALQCQLRELVGDLEDDNGQPSSYFMEASYAADRVDDAIHALSNMNCNIRVNNRQS